MNVVFIHSDSQGEVSFSGRMHSRLSWKMVTGFLMVVCRAQLPGEIPVHKATDRVRMNLKQDFVSERLAQPETIAFYDLF